MARNGIGLALALALVGCSGGASEGATSGTCDWSELSTKMTCLEQSGDATDVASQRDACLANEGTWTFEPCPVRADLIGCCAYTLGLLFRECFYERPDRAYDPETVCTGTTFDGSPGVWTPAPVVPTTCDSPDAGQCAVYTLPADWPVDVAAACTAAGGEWGAPCPEPGRVGTCTCPGASGYSTVVHYYGTLWTAGTAAAACDPDYCTWAAP